MGNTNESNQGSVIGQRVVSVPATVQLIENPQITEAQKVELESMAPILKMKYLEVLNKLRKYEFDTAQLQIVLGSKHIKLGTNFIGRVKQRDDTLSQIIGPAIYFVYQKPRWEIFVGYFQNNKPIRKGIKIETVDIKSSNMKVMYCENWDEQESKGCYFQKKPDKNKQIVFVGIFNKDKTMKEGNYQEFILDALYTRYTGTFEGNLPHSLKKYGQIYMPGKFRYRGYLKQGERCGFGVEQDIIKKVKYFGQFKNNKKHGYGQLIYEGEKQIIFKGFWKDGIVQTHKQKAANSKRVHERANGVFYDHNGDIVEQFHLRFY